MSFTCGKPTPSGPCQRLVTVAGVDCGVDHPGITTTSAAKTSATALAAQASRLVNNRIPPSVVAPDYPPLVQTGRGRYSVTDTLTQCGSGVGGEPDRKAHALAAGRWAAEALGAGRNCRSELSRMDGEQVTVLLQGHSGSVDAYEGTVVAGRDGNIGLLNKGDRIHGRYLTGWRDSPMIIDYEAGYGNADRLAGNYRRYETQIPGLTRSHFDDIPLTERRLPNISAVFVFTQPDFDRQPVPGYVFFATERDPENVINGYLSVPPGSCMCSENGSFYTADLARRGGRVASYRPGAFTFKDAMTLASSREATVDQTEFWQTIRDGRC